MKVIFHDLEIDLKEKKVRRQDVDLKLTPLTFKLLEVLLNHGMDTVSAEQLQEQVWGKSAVSSDTVKQRILILRNSLGQDEQGPQYIKSMRQIGYALGFEAKLIDDNPADSTKHKFSRNIGLIFGCILLMWLIAFWALTPEARQGSDRRIMMLPVTDNNHFPLEVNDKLKNSLLQFENKLIEEVDIQFVPYTLELRQQIPDLRVLRKQLDLDYIIRVQVFLESEQLKLQLVDMNDERIEWMTLIPAEKVSNEFSALAKALQ